MCPGTFSSQVVWLAWLVWKENLINKGKIILINKKRKDETIEKYTINKYTE